MNTIKSSQSAIKINKLLCMGQFKTSLKPDDLKLLYDVLYQYENEGKRNHKGYFYMKVPFEIKNKVSLIHDTSKNKIKLSFPETPNTLCYKGKEVCKPLFKHLRNSFAHACIEREGDYYVINSQMNPKCQICGKVKRKDFKDFVTAILATKE